MIDRPATDRVRELAAARPRPPRPTRGYRAFRIVNALVLSGLVLVTLYPFVNVVARSLSDEGAINAGRVNLLPVGINVQTYRFVFGDRMFWINYRNTVVYTVVATAISMVLTTMFAYVLSKRHLRGHRLLLGTALFTMFFSGGLIPNYVLVTSLGMKNSIWAIALPNAVNVFNLLVMKAFFENFPAELEEAAEIDGLSTYGILLRIVVPLSKAVMATMTLFYSVSFWNSWFAAFIYMDRRELFPVTVYLRNIISSASGTAGIGASYEQATQVGANIQSVTMVLTVVPILLVYPFVQRYFVTGVMLGAVKG